MSILIYTLFKTVVISYALSSLANFLGDLIMTINENNTNYWGKIGLYCTSYLLTCHKCFSFWLSLIISGDLLIAAVTSIIIATIFELQTLFKNDIIV